MEQSSRGILQWLKYAFYDLTTVRRMITMKLFNRSSNAEEKWHKKALFVDFSKTRMVFIDTTGKKPECESSRIRELELQFVIKELLNQEQYGLLGFFSCP